MECTSSAAFFGATGAASALVFANLGAAYGTAKAGVGVVHLGIMNHTKVCQTLYRVVICDGT